MNAIILMNVMANAKIALTKFIIGLNAAAGVTMTVIICCIIILADIRINTVLKYGKHWKK